MFETLTYLLKINWEVLELGVTTSKCVLLFELNFY